MFLFILVLQVSFGQSGICEFDAEVFFTSCFEEVFACFKVALDASGSVKEINEVFLALLRVVIRLAIPSSEIDFLALLVF